MLQVEGANAEMSTHLINWLGIRHTFFFSSFDTVSTHICLILYTWFRLELSKSGGVQNRFGPTHD